MRKRIFFNKYSKMKFISHLDTLRLMDRIFKISGIELEYTNGFHPRPKMSFGNPISLGEEAYNEPMDVEIVDNNYTEEKILNKLNNSSPEGLEFVSMCNIDKKNNIATAYDVIEYKLELENENNFKQLEKLLSQSEIIETKQKKDKIKKRDLKLRIKGLTTSEKSNEYKVFLMLENMSPNAFLKLLEIEPSTVKIARLGYKKLI